MIGRTYRITKYFTLLVGYALTPFSVASSGFRAAAAQVVAANPKLAPYNLFSTDAILNNTPGALDGFPILAQAPSGPTGNRIYPGDPLRTHFRSGIYFGVGIPLSLKGIFTPSNQSSSPSTEGTNANNQTVQKK